MATSKNDILDSVVKRVDDALVSGQKLPWQKPWEPQYGAMSMPHNPITGKTYSPGNTMILSIAAMDHGHDDPRYMTYKQARDAGWSVRKGEHAAAHIYAPITKTLTDEKTGVEEQKIVGYRGVALFNAAQIDGIPPMAIVPESERLPKTLELDAIAQQMGVRIQHAGGMAFYRSSDDQIQLPPRETFTDQHGYDATKAHELTHATGHPSRLNRDKQYQTIKGRAAEEMTAEIGAYLMSQRLGVPFMGNSPDMTDQQHAAYLAGWAKDLTQEERRIAIDNGIKAATYMEKQLELARANGLVVEASREQAVDPIIVEHNPTMESGMSPEPASAAEVTITDPDKSAGAQILRQVPDGLRPFMSNSQRMATEAGLRGEEKGFFSEKLREMMDLVDKMPVSYGTDGMGDNAPVSLHYYKGNADWYIMEKDVDHDGAGQLQARGLADLGVGHPEVGYISIQELVEHGAEMDYHFSPRTLLELKQEKYPGLIRESLPEPVLSLDNASPYPEKQGITDNPISEFNKGDLITYVDPAGKSYDGIILKNADFSVGEDGKEGVTTRWQPVQANENKSNLEPHNHIIATYSVNGRINKDEFTRHLPNVVPDIGHVDPASRNYEKDIDRRRGLHAALEARVSHTLNGLAQQNSTHDHAEEVMTQVKIQHGDARTNQPLHKITLTHRTDLKDRICPVSIPGKPDLELRNHPRQEISGVLKDFSKSEFILETPEFGAVRVETGKNMFMSREEELRAAIGKPVDVALDKTGKELSLAVHQGLAGGSQGVNVLFDKFDTPALPFGLMPAVDMGKTTDNPVTGKLTYVHDRNVIELRSAGKPVLVYGKEPDKAHQAEIRDLIGKQVRVSADKDTGQLTVKAVQPMRQKDLGLER